MPWTAWAWRAATAAFAKRQKPIGRLGSAWWPGGRVAQKTRRTSPRHTASTPATAAPAARSAASALPQDMIVSPSSATLSSGSGRTDRIACT